MSVVVKASVLGEAWSNILDACDDEYPVGKTRDSLKEFFKNRFNARLFTYEHDIWGNYYIEFQNKEDFVLLMLEWV